MELFLRIFITESTKASTGPHPEAKISYLNPHVLVFKDPFEHYPPLYAGFPQWSFLFGFPSNILFIFLISPMCCVPCSSLSIGEN